MEDLDKQTSEAEAGSELSNEQVEQVKGGAIDTYMWFLADPAATDEQK